MKTTLLTHKNKFFILLFGMITMSYLVYRIKLKPTLTRIKKITLMDNSEQNNTEKLNAEIDYLIQREGEINQTLTGTISSNFSSQLIKKIIRFDPNINTTHVSAQCQFKDGIYDITSFHFTLKNDFKTTLKLIDFIEKEIKNLRLISIHYESKKNHYKSNKKELYATLYIQNISLH